MKCWRLVLWLVVALCLLSAPLDLPGVQAGPPRDPVAPSAEQWTIKVYVLTFNPLIEGQPLTANRGWNDPSALMTDHSADMAEASGGLIQYQIAEETVPRVYPVKSGGFVFTNEQYLGCLNDDGGAGYCSEMIDYPTVLNTRYAGSSMSACEAISTGAADEVWLWGGPWFGYWEYAVIEPHTQCAAADRRFTVMGYSYERGTPEMIHNQSHRVESALQQGLGLALWDRFDGQRQRYPQDYACPPQPDAGHPEVDAANAHCGNTEFPPNAYCHYQTDRDYPVLSDCGDWPNFPNLTGQKTEINADDWGANELGYQTWWMQHLPRNPGAYEGVHNNWWKYLYPQVSSGPIEAEARVEPAAFCPGWNLNYTVRVANDSGQALARVVISDEIPIADTWFANQPGDLGGSAPGAYNPDTGVIVWEARNVAAGETVEGRVRLHTYRRIASGSRVTNTFRYWAPGMAVPGLISAEALADGSLCATATPTPTRTRTPSPTVTRTLSPTATHTPSVTPTGVPRRVYLPILMREWSR